MLTNKCTKHIYKNINIECVQPSAFLKWNSELVLKCFPEVELKNVFKVCFKGPRHDLRSNIHFYYICIKLLTSTYIK